MRKFNRYKPSALNFLSSLNISCKMKEKQYNHHILKWKENNTITKSYIICINKKLKNTHEDSKQWIYIDERKMHTKIQFIHNQPEEIQINQELLIVENPSKTNTFMSTDTMHWVHSLRPPSVFWTYLTLGSVLVCHVLYFNFIKMTMARLCIKKKCFEVKLYYTVNCTAKQTIWRDQNISFFPHRRSKKGPTFDHRWTVYANEIISIKRFSGNISRPSSDIIATRTPPSA